MKDQHEKIAGYRDLSQAELDLMNRIKAKGREIGKLCEELQALAPQRDVGYSLKTSTGAHIHQVGLESGEIVLRSDDGSVFTDPRWLAIGQTHLQQGLMAITRAVARPDFF